MERGGWWVGGGLNYLIRPIFEVKYREVKKADGRVCMNLTSVKQDGPHTHNDRIVTEWRRYSLSSPSGLRVGFIKLTTFFFLISIEFARVGISIAKNKLGR